MTNQFISLKTRQSLIENFVQSIAPHNVVTWKSSKRIGGKLKFLKHGDEEEY